MLVKASSITNLTDARYFAAREVDFLGFNLDEGTEGYVEPSVMRAIREWVEGPRIVGEFSTAPAEVVREAAAFFQLDAVQVRASAHLDALPTLADIPVLLELEADISPAAAEAIMRQATPLAQFFVLPFSVKHRSDADTAAWATLFVQYPVLLHTSASSAHLPELLSILKIKGLSLTGGEEERVGVKSFDEIEEVFEVLEGLYQRINLSPGPSPEERGDQTAR